MKKTLLILFAFTSLVYGQTIRQDQVRNLSDSLKARVNYKDSLLIYATPAYVLSHSSTFTKDSVKVTAPITRTAGSGSVTIGADTSVLATQSYVLAHAGTPDSSVFATKYDAHHYADSVAQLYDSRSKSQVFTSSGTFTVPKGVTEVWLNGVGGGGGGAASSDTTRHYMTLNGSTQYISKTSPPSISGAFTIELWVYPTLSGAGQTIWDNNAGSNQCQFGINSNNTWQVVLGDNSSHYVNPSCGSASFNQWQEIAIVSGGSGDSVRIFKNGVQLGGTSLTFNPVLFTSGLGWYVGDYPAYSQFFHGYVTEVRIWSAALSQSTIATWYAKGITASHPNYSSLKFYWKFVDGTGATVTDLSGNGYNGTTTASPLWVAIDTIGGGGGAAGETLLHYPLSVTQDSVITITLGAQGVGGVSQIFPTTATAGGVTSFVYQGSTIASLQGGQPGTLLGVGGAGGGLISNGSGGTAGSGVGGATTSELVPFLFGGAGGGGGANTKTAGGNGGPSLTQATSYTGSSHYGGGSGASTPFGTGGKGAMTGVGSATSGTNGAGGGGDSMGNTNTQAGNGGLGWAMIEWIAQ